MRAFLSILGLCLFVYLATSPNNFLKEERTVFIKGCSTGMPLGKCNAPSFVFAHRYKAFLDTQTVVQRNDSATVLKDCYVYDSKNWRCKAEGNDIISMSDGKLFSTDFFRIKNGKIDVYYSDISRFEYLCLKFLGLFS